MTINWSSGVLNSSLAPGIAQFDVCELPDLKPEHPQASHWLSNHFLNTTFRAQFGEAHRQYVFNLLFRAQTVFAIYHEARDATLAYLANSTPNNPTISRYFDMISRWESCLLNVQIFIDVLNKIESSPVFSSGDRSVEDRAYGMANTIKHWGSQIASGKDSTRSTIPLWVSNTALVTHAAELTYLELAQLVRETSALANQIEDPLKFVSTLAD